MYFLHFDNLPSTPVVFCLLQNLFLWAFHAFIRELTVESDKKLKERDGKRHATKVPSQTQTRDVAVHGQRLHTQASRVLHRAYFDKKFNPSHFINSQKYSEVPFHTWNLQHGLNSGFRFSQSSSYMTWPFLGLKCWLSFFYSSQVTALLENKDESKNKDTTDKELS